MLDPQTLGRIYKDGIAAADIDVILPNFDDNRLLLVEPVMPPATTKGGIIIPGQSIDVPGTAAVLFRVVRDDFGDHAADSVQGEVVLLRNAMLEPLGPSMALLLIARRHVLATVLVPEVEAEVEAEPDPTIFRGVAMKVTLAP